MGELANKPTVVPDVQPEISFDLDRVIAERDVTPPFTFTFGGEVYSLPPRPDMIANTHLVAGRLDEGFERLFGPSQWDRIQKSDAVLDDLGLLQLFEAYQEHMGEDLGESKASPKRSRNTAKR